MSHVHGALYQERGLLTSRGKEIKNKVDILALLEAIWLPKKLAVINCRGHQQDTDLIARGNALADATAKAAGKRPVGPVTILPTIPQRELPPKPVYSDQERMQASRLKADQTDQGWHRLPDGRIFLPRALAIELIRTLHSSTHLGTSKLISLLGRHLYIPDLRLLASSETARCAACTRVNPGPPPTQIPGVRQRGREPGEHWEIDFTRSPQDCSGTNTS